MVSIEPLKKEGVSFFRSSGQYQLDLPADVWTDLEAGFSAVDRAEAHLRNGSPEQVLGPAGAAACIARRPFLPGIEGFWVDSLRGKLHHQLLRALDCLSESQRLVGEPMVAVETGTEAVKLDNLRERGYQLLMQTYSAAGNRAEALNVYHQCREILAAEVGTEPSQETQEIYQSLLE
jgi:DNA-binding SARP family transcriptional activator